MMNGSLKKYDKVTFSSKKKILHLINSIFGFKVCLTKLH